RCSRRLSQWLVSRVTVFDPLPRNGSSALAEALFIRTHSKRDSGKRAWRSCTNATTNWRSRSRTKQAEKAKTPCQTAKRLWISGGNGFAERGRKFARLATLGHSASWSLDE